MKRAATRWEASAARRGVRLACSVAGQDELDRDVFPRCGCARALASCVRACEWREARQRLDFERACVTSVPACACAGDRGDWTAALRPGIHGDGARTGKGGVLGTSCSPAGCRSGRGCEGSTPRLRGRLPRRRRRGRGGGWRCARRRRLRAGRGVPGAVRVERTRRRTRHDESWPARWCAFRFRVCSAGNARAPRVRSCTPGGGLSQEGARPGKARAKEGCLGADGAYQRRVGGRVAETVTGVVAKSGRAR